MKLPELNNEERDQVKRSIFLQQVESPQAAARLGLSFRRYLKLVELGAPQQIVENELRIMAKGVYMLDQLRR